MRPTTHCWLAFLLLLSVCTSSNLSGDETRPLDKIRWLLGDWSRTTEKTTTRESWSDTGKGIFQGDGSVASNDDGQVRSRESLLLVEMSGEVFYIAKVAQNQLPVPFKLVSSSPTHAVFENMKHDFPKRLTYRLGEDDRLDVTVSDGAQRSFVIPFTKATSKRPVSAEKSSGIEE